MPSDLEKDGVVTVLPGVLVDEAYAHAEGIDPVFMAKASVINSALEECGMGRFQCVLPPRAVANGLNGR